MIYLQTALLAAIVGLLVLILRRKDLAPIVNVPAPIVNVTAPAAQPASMPPIDTRRPRHASDIWEVCEKRGDRLHPIHHVREGSDRHRDALESGAYLRRGDQIVGGK